LAELRELLVRSHQERFGSTDDLVIGFQLTHSGRFCRPSGQLTPRVAYRHPLLDSRFAVNSDAQVLSDAEVGLLIKRYVEAAKIARDAGADFVDIKHCHGYLLHEFLSAYTRPGPYGGSFENRTRILREIISGIRDSGNTIEIGVRLSAFDVVPFKPDPALSAPGKPGPGIPEDFSKALPYRYAFGVNPSHPTEPDLAEACQFARLCLELGVKILNLSAGSPYYNPHIQRPAAYPPSDGYQPPEDPLIGVVRQIQAVRAVRESLNKSGKASGSILLVGSAYSYLQEYLPHVAQSVIRHRWADLIGLGRMILAYPGMLADATQSGALTTKLICRTFSDCTTAPRNGLISGCYPLDKYYASKPEAAKLKDVKKK
jgi:2,4-dienoyl-CoA reductase-like NADH-dependent reductase (Old Yellow Enzyme family)